MRGIVLLVLAACTQPLTGLVVDHVEPPQGPAGAAMPVTLEGTFRLPIVSDLDQGDTTIMDGVPAATVGGIPIENVMWENDQRITGTIPTSLTTGTHDVTVVLGGQTHTLAGGYTATENPAPFALTGARWLLPCDPGTNGNPNATACLCGSTSSDIDIGGNPGERWRVTARIRGVLEYMQYVGGIQGPGDSYIGGIPNDGGNNVYAFAISAPFSLYYINSNASLAGTQSNSWEIDYEITFDLEAGATVGFGSTGQDGVQWEGVDAGDAAIALPDVTDPPQPYNGQFARIDVLSAVPF